MVDHILLEEAVVRRTSHPLHHPSAQRYPLPGIRPTAIPGTLFYDSKHHLQV
jgi:hypothetical protein